MYKRVLKDLQDTNGKPRQAYRHAYQKLEAMYNKLDAKNKK